MQILPGWSDDARLIDGSGRFCNIRRATKTANFIASATNAIFAASGKRLRRLPVRGRSLTGAA